MNTGCGMLKLIETPGHPVFPFTTMQWVCDLEYYDGPLQSYFKTDTDHYIWYWCDYVAGMNRWMVFRVSEETIRKLLKPGKEFNLADIMPACFLDSCVYFVDRFFWDDFITRVLVTDIPKDYLPEQGSVIETY